MVIRTSPAGTQSEPRPDAALSGLVEEWVSSMAGQHLSHAVIISGEEGAGKTFTAKLIMDYLMSMKSTTKSLTRQVTAGWMVMRSLGSAATARNRRSSRMVIAYLQYLHIVHIFIINWDLSGCVDGVSAKSQISIKIQTPL